MVLDHSSPQIVAPRETEAGAVETTDIITDPTASQRPGTVLMRGHDLN